MSIPEGALYVVATPIGNLGDISSRAIETLSSADLIAAEDTRHSARLLRAFSISTPCIALHEHNEREQVAAMIRRLEDGQRIALISDAGTPLVSDPGYLLVREARSRGLAVIPVPGASAVMAALSVSGLPTDRFVFEGFLSSKAAARKAQLLALVNESRTLVFFESPHRVVATLQAMAEVFGGPREAVVARELTKLHETVRTDTLDTLCRAFSSGAEPARGEFVLLVRGVERDQRGEDEADQVRMLTVLMGALPLKKAVAVARELSGGKRNRLYELAIGIRGEQEKDA